MKKHPKERMSYRAAWTHIWIPALREVDLEPSAKRGTNRARALVILEAYSRIIFIPAKKRIIERVQPGKIPH